MILAIIALILVVLLLKRLLPNHVCPREEAGYPCKGDRCECRKK